jgi:hypothetical protein
MSLALEFHTGLSRGWSALGSRFYSAHRPDGEGVVLSIECGRFWIDITLLRLREAS